MQMTKTYRKLLVLFGTVVVFLGTFTLIQYQLIEDKKTDQKQLAAKIKEAEWTIVWNEVSSLRLQAIEKANLIADRIRSDVKKEYKTSPRLKNDLSLLTKDTNPLVEILGNSIQSSWLNNVKTDSNDPFIMTREGIASDFSKDCASDTRTRSFGKEIMLHYNKLLAKDAIVNLLLVNENNPLIGWQFSTPKNPDFSTNEFSEKELKNLYFKYGLSSLKSFEFLSAAYIENNQDLLGNPIVSNSGILNQNYQLIVVQGFNLVEQLESNPTVLLSLSNVKAFEAEYDALCKKEISFLQIELVSVFGMMFLVFFVGSLLLNREARQILEIGRKPECEE